MGRKTGGSEGAVVVAQQSSQCMYSLAHSCTIDVYRCHVIDDHTNLLAASGSGYKAKQGQVTLSGNAVVCAATSQPPSLMWGLCYTW